MNDHRRTMEIYAFMGFIGGIVFVIGDCLLYCYKGYSGLGVDSKWIEVDEWRFILSAWLGFAGMILMLPAFYSYYKMIEETCGKVLRTLASFMAVGVAATGFLHFTIGPLLPITYKSIIFVGGTAEIAYAVAERLQGIMTPLEIALIVFLFLEYITHFVAVVSRKTGLPRIMCLVGPVGTLVLGIIWKAAFRNTVAAGAWGACESMGEALVFLTAAIYWRKKQH